MDAIKTKGYFISPSQLFANVVATANTNQSLTTPISRPSSPRSKPLPVATLSKMTSMVFLQTSTQPAIAWAIRSKTRTHAWRLCSTAWQASR